MTQKELLELLEEATILQITMIDPTSTRSEDETLARIEEIASELISAAGNNADQVELLFGLVADHRASYLVCLFPAFVLLCSAKSEKSLATIDWELMDKAIKRFVGR